MTEFVFQEVAEHKSDVFHDFESGRDSKKILSTSCHISAVQVVISILQICLKCPARVSKENYLWQKESSHRCFFMMHHYLMKNVTFCNCYKMYIIIAAILLTNI